MNDILSWLDSLDRALFHFINGTLANPITDLLMPFFTADLNLKIFYAACLLLILWKGDARLRWAIIFSLIVVTLTDQLASHVVKPWVGRLRPCHEMTVHLLVGCGGGKSMPSSHAANLFGQAAFFWMVYKPSAKYLFSLAVVVALSRVFVGVHYPGDIVVGAILGIVIGLALGLVYNKYTHPFLKSRFNRKQSVDAH